MSDIFEEYAELVRRYKDGDEAAFGELYDKSSRFVYATCLGVLGNPEDASDAMQETYLTVYKSIDSLADEKNLIGWIKKIAVTRSLNMLRRKKDETSYDDALASEEILEGDDDLESLPDYYIVEKTGRDTLHKLIRSALSDVQYQTVLFHYFDEMSVEEIADVMGCPVGTVKTRLKSSRIRIKREVEKYEKENDDRLAVFAGVPFLTGFFNARAADISVPDIAPLIMEALGAAKDAAEGVAESAAKDAAESVAKSSASRASSVTKTAAAASESAKTGAAGFLATAAGKAAAFIAAAVLIVGAVIGVTQLLGDKEKKEKDRKKADATSEVTEVTEDTEVTEVTENAENDDVSDRIKDGVTVAERAPAVEVTKDELPDYDLLASLTRWYLIDYDHTRPDEELYYCLFPYDTYPLVHFPDYDPDYKHEHDLQDPRGVFEKEHTNHIKAEAFYWLEKNVLALSDKDMEEFNRLLIPYEKDGEMVGAYIEGDTVWFTYPRKYDYRTRRNLKILFDGEYYYIEYLTYDDSKWRNDPDYYRYEDGNYIFFVLQHNEVDGRGVWAVISTSDDPSTFPGEPAEIPTREADEEARQRAIEEHH